MNYFSKNVGRDLASIDVVGCAAGTPPTSEKSQCLVVSLI